MANEEQLAILRQGVEAWNAWRQKHPAINPDLGGAGLCGADLRGVHLSGAKLDSAKLGEANLIGAILRGADLRHADLRGADLGEAELRHADLRHADLCGADLHGAILHRADLREAYLVGADLRGADLRQAALIDSCLDEADLTDALLWETQRMGWSIEGIVCRRAFWDREGAEPTEYGDGEFERIFTKKPHIVLRYPGGVSPVDLAMLPLIVERLQAEHPGSKLHIRSLQDEGSGASVTIAVEDLEDRDAEAFEAEVDTLRGSLAAIQDRLRGEESLRLTFETKYQALVQDVLPMLLKQALPRQEVHLGHVTAPVTIEGTAMSRDTYNISGQAGAVGSGAHAHDNVIQQLQGGLDLPRLAEEFARLRTALRQEGKCEPEEDEAIGAVVAAEKAAKQGDEADVLRHLRTAGTWTLGIAEKIGVPLAVEVLKRVVT